MEQSSEYAFPVFVSSTARNLQDLRAELRHYLSELGYRPILSSSEGFPDNYPELEPWESCLPVLGSCFVIILVIDGKYGESSAWPNFEKIFGKEPISPTHAEYRYAHRLRKRMLVFIRNEIMNFYESYRSTFKKVNDDINECRKLLEKTLPDGIQFETLQFIDEVKTARPIPWIKTFADVTEIKSEIQKKMLNELAEIFLIKSKRLEVVTRAFSGALEDLSPEKCREVLQSIGATREIISENEKKSSENEKLKESLVKIEKELSNANAEIEKGKKSKDEKDKLDLAVEKLKRKQKELLKQIQENRAARNGLLTGTILSNKTAVNGTSVANQWGNTSILPIDPSIGTYTTINTLAKMYLNDSNSNSILLNENNILGGSDTYTSIFLNERCERCGKTDKAGSISQYRICPKCGKKLCSSCWLPTTSDICDQCRIVHGNIGSPFDELK